jgi:hypothetical protein
MVTKEDIREEDRAILESFMHTHKVKTPEEAKKEVTKEIKECQVFFKKNRYNSSINRVRREYARKLAYFKHVQDIILGRYHGEPQHEHDITFTGLRRLSITEIEEIERQAAILYRKLKRKRPDLKMHVVVKKYHKLGKTSKYSISLHLEMQGKVYADTNQADWDIARTFHKVSEAIRFELDHKEKNKRRR